MIEDQEGGEDPVEAGKEEDAGGWESLEEEFEQARREGAGGGDNGLSHEDGAEKARKPNVRKAPRTPTQQEREEHNATHAEFKEWCKCGVLGAGRQTPHMVSRDNEKGDGVVPKVSMDYFYMSTEEERAMENSFIKNA